jgi:chorismate-pyruvate lyase
MSVRADAPSHRRLFRAPCRSAGPQFSRRWQQSLLAASLPSRSAVLLPSAIVAPFFPTLAAVGEFESVAPADMPREYRSLLAHNDHMTVTVEAFHNCLVDVRVLDEHNEAEFYSRTSLLACQATDKVVQFGVMRIDLGQLAPAVRDEITGRGTPLGRVLIRHNVLRHVELQQLWQVNPSPQLRDLLQLASGETVYGRSARIVVEGRPAVELLEIPRA